MKKACVFTFTLLLISLNIIRGQEIILKTQAEVDAFNPGTTTITGKLTITGAGVLPADAIRNLNALFALTNITSTLTIYGNDSLVDLSGLSHLTYIGGNLIIEQNNTLTNLDSLYNLRKIKGSFTIDQNGVLTSIELMRLDTIGQSLTIENVAVTDLGGFSSLKHIGSSLSISWNSQLTQISGFPLLQSIKFGLSLYHNKNLQSIVGFENLETIGSSLTMNDNDKLIDISGFVRLKFIGQKFYLVDLPVLPNLNSFPALDTIMSDITMFRNPKLQHIDGLSNLKLVGGNIYLENLFSLTNLNGFSELKEVKGSFTIQGTRLLVNLDGLENLDSVGSMVVNDNQALNQINALSGLTSCKGDMVIKENSVLDNVSGLSNLVYVQGNLILERNKLLSLQGISNLTSVGGTFRLWNTAINWNSEGPSKLTNIGGDFFLYTNGSINWSGFSNLVSIGGDAHLQSEDLSNFIGLSGLTSIGGNLEVQYTSQENFDGLDKLSSIGGSMIVEGNSYLKSVGPLPSLDTIGEGVRLYQNFDLENINGLAKVSKLTYLELFENVNLQNLDGLVQLTSVLGPFSLMTHYHLQNINGLSSLTTVGNDFIIHLNKPLRNLDSLINLVYVGGNLKITSHDSLEDISGLQYLSTVKGSFIVQANHQLNEFPVLKNFTSIGGNLEIIGNKKLGTIKGAAKLTSIKGSFIVRSNALLSKIGKFAHQGKIRNDLDISYNPKLTDCCGIQELIITYSVDGDIHIKSNDTGCDSLSEVIHSKCNELRIYNDMNANCLYNDEENWLPGRLATVQPGNYIFPFGGQYGLEILPEGQYTIYLDTTGPWETNCPITQDFQVIGYDIVPSVEPFGITSTEPCSDPEVSIAIGRVRPCMEQIVHVQACNYLNGTRALSNANVIVTLDPILSFISSSMPSQVLGGSEYLFDVGNLSPNECVDFSIKVVVSCEAIQRQNLCLTARLFPIDSCVFRNDPPMLNTNDCQFPYDGSHIKVHGWCEEDSLIFEVKNESNLDMTCEVPVRFYANSQFDSEERILLLQNEIKRYAFMADSRTWRIEVDQHPLHPGHSNPTTTIERCGGLSLWDAGHVNERYHDDEDPFTDIFCATVTGSYDPNDKIGFPTGVGSEHHIMPGQWVDYMIRFQNTGTDTAFKVVIKDTLDPDFQILSVRAGVASHPYTFNMYGQGVLEWTFDDILLPDSNTNEPASHGFITFRVNQLQNLINGSVLENDASIYFDFNDPVMTNTTRHVIDNRTNSILSDMNDAETYEKSFSLFPNPTTNEMTIGLDKSYRKIKIDILSMVGITLFSQTYFNTSLINISPALTPGMFILVVQADQNQLKSTKFIIH